MVQVHRTIPIKMHQCTRLVEMGQRERNPKLHRRQRDPFLQDHVFSIKRIYSFTARTILGAFLQLIHQRGQHVVFINQLPIRCGVLTLAIEIRLAYIKWVLPHLDGNRIHQPLRREHPLRATKTTESCIRNRICFQPLGSYENIWIEITVIRMEHRTIIDTKRQIR